MEKQKFSYYAHDITKDVENSEVTLEEALP